MKQKKQMVGILFGGKSAEHEVSINSAQTVLAALDPKLFIPVVIKIKKSGEWVLLDDAQQEVCPVALLPASGGILTRIGSTQAPIKLDVVFPVLHGPFGEDGTVQGLLKLAGVPFVGASVLGSAVGMDKDVMKRLLRDAGIPIAKFLVATKNTLPSFAEAKKELGMPCFIKPANLGSSVGVSKASTQAEYDQALQTALLFDRKIILEEFIDGREIECSVMGNDAPIASLPGEIVPTHSFYSYESKYVDKNGAEFAIPAKLPPVLTAKIQALAVQAFSVLACEGLGRVDFFLTKQGELLVNEINTIPGFTSVSMYPKMWEVSGVALTQLVTRLLEFALERFKHESDLRTNY